MNLEQNLQNRFESHCKENNIWFTYYSNYNRMIDCDNLIDAETIQFIQPIYKAVKLPKQKLITLEYILDKLSEQKEFNSLTKKVKAILNTGYSCYPTSYGVGVECLFGESKSISLIEKFLDNNGIEYTNEYSQARWIYRFKISKKQENIKRLQILLTL